MNWILPGFQTTIQLSPQETLILIANQTEDWASPLSAHIGGGGRFIHGDHALARAFEGELDEGGFLIQRIQYRGQSRGPRLWTRGTVSRTPDGGTFVEVRHRPRLTLFLWQLSWLAVGGILLTFALTFFDRLPPWEILLAFPALLAANLLFLFVGFRMETGIINKRLHTILSSTAQQEVRRPPTTTEPPVGEVDIGGRRFNIVTIVWVGLAAATAISVLMTGITALSALMKIPTLLGK